MHNFRRYILKLFLISSCIVNSAQAMVIKERSLPNLGSTCFFNATLNLLFNSGFNEKFLGTNQYQDFSEPLKTFQHRQKIKQAIFELWNSTQASGQHSGNGSGQMREAPVGLDRKVELVQEITKAWNNLRKAQGGNGYTTFELKKNRQQDMAEALRQVLNILEYPTVLTYEVLNTVENLDVEPVLNVLADDRYFYLYLHEEDARELSLQDVVNRHYGENLTIIPETQSWGLIKGIYPDAYQSRYVDQEIRDGYFIVEDRIYADWSAKEKRGVQKKRPARVVFDFERPIVEIPVMDFSTKQTSVKYMRVSSVGVHVGGAGSGHYYTISMDKTKDGGYQWMTYDDTRVYPGVDKYLNSVGSRVFHLVELDGEWAERMDTKADSGVPTFPADKEYIILSADTGLSLNIEGDASAQKSNVAVLDYNPRHPTWKIQTLAGDKNVISLQSNLVLNVDGRAKTHKNNSNVNIHKFFKNDDGQRWEIVPSFIEGGYFIRSVASKLVLNVQGSNAQSGRNVNIYGQARDLGQIWYIVEKDRFMNFGVAQKAVSIVSASDGQALKVLGELTKNGSAVGSNPEVDSIGGDKWVFQMTDDGSFSIRTSNGKALNVSGKTQNHKDGSAVNIFAFRQGDKGLLWEVLPGPIPGFYIIRSAATHMALTLVRQDKNSSTAAISPYKARPEQLWYILEE